MFRWVVNNFFQSLAIIFVYGMVYRASLVVQRLKRLPAMWETWVQSLGREDPLEKEMAAHSSILAWRINGRRSLVGYSPRVAESDTTERLHFHFHFTGTKLYILMLLSVSFFS